MVQWDREVRLEGVVVVVLAVLEVEHVVVVQV